MLWPAHDRPGIARALPLLYSFRRCPYAIRARMALEVAGIAVDIQEVALRQKPAALIAASPKATVPVLVTPEGQVIDESLAIMQWALAQNDPAGWLAADPASARPGCVTDCVNDCTKDCINSWIVLCDDKFKPLLDRYKYADRHPEHSPAEHRRQAMVAFIEPLAAQLNITPWLTGSTISIADVAVFPFVRQFASVDKPWFDAQALPALQAWLGYWLGSELFKQVMKNRPLPIGRAV